MVSDLFVCSCFTGYEPKSKTNISMSLEECRHECLKNCSCTAFTSVTEAQSPGGARGCRLFYGDLIDTRQYGPESGQDLFDRVDATDLAKSIETSKGHLHKKHLAALLVCIALAFTLAICFATWFYRKKSRESKEQQQRSLWLEDVDGSNSTSEPVFQHSVIVVATKNFDPTNARRRWIRSSLPGTMQGEPNENIAKEQRNTSQNTSELIL